MGRYKLGIKGNNGRVINLDSIIKIKDLEELDNFTTQFQTEEELKAYLQAKTLLNYNEIITTDNIRVMYKHDGEVKKLKVAYLDIKKYLDITYLRYELKSLCSDVKFLEKLANFYDNGSTKFNKQGLNVQDIRNYLSDVRSNGGKTFYSKSLETAINDLYKKAILKEENKETGEVKLNYRGLRDLAFFIYKYKNPEIKKEDLQQTMDLGEENKKVSKPEEYEQSDMFDILDDSGKWELSSEGDPDFPYNSEEERNYKRYLEELEEKTNYPIEEHDHYRRR